MEPILNIKTKKRKSTKKNNHYISVKIRRAADPSFPPTGDYNYILNMSEEELIEHRKRVNRAVAERLKNSPRFRKRSARFVNSDKYIREGRKTKICTHCNKELGILAFDKQKDSRHSKKAVRPYCFNCRKLKNREYYLKRKELNDTTRVC